MMQSKKAVAFTLVELLTVIAIITVLAAVLFPVIGSVQEKVRQSTCMTNLMRIQQAVKSYHLDRGRYPVHLFGPAVCPDGTIPPDPPPPAHEYTTMGAVAKRITSKSIAPDDIRLRRTYQHSLFPEYIRDLSIYHCPNNTIYQNPDLDSGTPNLPWLWKPLQPQSVVPKWQLLHMYRYDSYDVSPRMDPTTGKLDLGHFVFRYSRNWFPYSGSNPPAGVSEEEYRRQLIWRHPEEDGYLTLCAYHAASTGTVPTVFLNGTVKPIRLERLRQLPDTGDPWRDPAYNGDFRVWQLTTTN